MRISVVEAISGIAARLRRAFAVVSVGMTGLYAGDMLDLPKEVGEDIFCGDLDIWIRIGEVFAIQKEKKSIISKFLNPVRFLAYSSPSKNSGK